jgi:hypothetical protein
VHPNEPQLVFRAESGAYLPTKAYTELSEAARGSKPHLAALAQQVERQTRLLP